MPSQRTILGRPVNFNLPPRRFQFAFVLALALVTLLVIETTSLLPVDVPAVDVITAHLPSAQSLSGIPAALNIPLNPFKPAVHKPPIQANTSLGENRWHIDWRWRNPFSSDVTLDEDRIVLPPPIPRPPVYTFYEKDIKASKKVHEAEDQLLLQWRRAWWAQGFKPVILGRAEAVNNPLYKKVQQLQLGDHMEVAITRWLAWATMGSGILAGWMVYPMAPYDDFFLSFLRRGQYPQLNRFENLGNALFCGEKDDIIKAINHVLASPQLKEASSLADKHFNGLFVIESDRNAIAHYDTNVVQSKYKNVAASLFNSPTAGNEHEGLKLLQHLINAHLQLTWQQRFSEGVAVLRLMPQHMSALIDPDALEIAGNLTSCPWSPDPASCPPNNPRCRKCVSSQPLTISTPPAYRNKSSALYQIGVVPHPYTTTALRNARDNVTPTFIRQQGMADRDMWLKHITQDIVGWGPSVYPRLTAFKEAVSGGGVIQSRSLWLTAERESTIDLDWNFGFMIPQTWPLDLHTSVTPVPGPERRPKIPEPEGGAVDPIALLEQGDRLRKARHFLGKKNIGNDRVVRAVEAWNLADTEVWKFARAWNARRLVERKIFEQEEGMFSGGERSGERKGKLGRWFDGR